MRAWGTGASVVVLLAGVACSDPGPVAKVVLSQPLAGHSTPSHVEAMRRARVWRATSVEAMNIRVGPQTADGFPFLATVRCRYVDKRWKGHSLKFGCDIGHDDIVKVKIGDTNGETFAEVAATRLLWALGFGADHMYPVKVVCRGCPARFGGQVIGRESRLFDPAAIERPMGGAELDDDPGWSWPELALLDESAGGASPTERDALKLMAVFLQHTDNKTEQQRVVCVDQTSAKNGADCRHPFLLLDDVGLTFGRATFTNADGSGSVNLRGWQTQPIWRDPEGCVGNLAPSFTGTLSYPEIGEDGRQLLSTLLMRLSRQQIRDLFEVSRFALRRMTSEDAPQRGLEDWVAAFLRKREEIANRRCSRRSGERLATMRRPGA